MPSAGTLRAVRRLLLHSARPRHALTHSPDRSLTAAPLQATGTGGLELTFLGSSSQGGARRYPSSLAMRLRALNGSEVWLFDAGEGAVAQLQRSSMKVGLVRNIFITHLHGDHLYGLPGILLSVLRSRVGEAGIGVTGGGGVRGEEEGLDVYGPQGIRAFLRMSLGVAGFHMPGRNLLRIHELVWPDWFGPKGKRNRIRIAGVYWKTPVKKLGYEGIGRDIEPLVEGGGEDEKFTYDLVSTDRENEGGAAKVVAAPVLHTVPTYAFSVTENVMAKRFDKDKLEELKVPSSGKAKKLFEIWRNGETATWEGKKIAAEEVMQDGRLPRKVCIVGDTYDADGAGHIAKGVDVLVHEATNVAAQTSLARMRGHSSTLGATSFAKKVGAKRLILNHSSVGYSERKLRSMEIEARGMFGENRAYVAKDLSVFTIPTCEEDDEEFVFRRFAGFANSLEYRGPDESDNPFGQDMIVEEEGEGVEADRGKERREEKDKIRAVAVNRKINSSVTMDGMVGRRLNVGRARSGGGRGGGVGVDIEKRSQIEVSRQR